MTTQEAIEILKFVPLYRYELELEKGRQSDLFKALNMAIEAMERKCSDCSRRKFYQIGFEAGKRATLERVLERLEELKGDCEKTYSEFLDGEDLRRALLLNEAIEIIKEEVG